MCRTVNKEEDMNIDDKERLKSTIEIKETKSLSTADVRSRLSSADQEELQKCKDSPVYFYNKYVRKDGQKELTEAEYNDFVKQVEYQRNMPLKLRKHYKDQPLLPSECFTKQF